VGMFTVGDQAIAANGPRADSLSSMTKGGHYGPLCDGWKSLYHNFQISDTTTDHISLRRSSRLDETMSCLCVLRTGIPTDTFWYDNVQLRIRRSAVLQFFSDASIIK